MGENNIRLNEAVKMSNDKPDARELLAKFKGIIKSTLDDNRTRTGQDYASDIGIALEACIPAATVDPDLAIQTLNDVVALLERDIAKRGNRVNLMNIRARGLALHYIATSDDEAIRNELAQYIKGLSQGKY